MSKTPHYEDAYPKPPNEAFLPRGKRLLNPNVGELVQRGSTVYRIAQVLDYQSLIGIEVETGRSVPLRTGELLPVTIGVEDVPGSSVEIESIPDEQWQQARRRYSAIEPFIGKQVNDRKAVKKRAAEFGVDTVTLYRWLKRYESVGVLTALLDRKRGWTSGQARIDPVINRVISEVLDDFYLTEQRYSAQRTVEEVGRRCHSKGLKPPSADTIRRRIGSIPEKVALQRRGFKELAKNRFQPRAGRKKGADYPLAEVQIDHTPADIILVDDVHRRPIERAYLTLATDVYSRMTIGYYLSLDKPSATSVGLCVAHASLPKEDWLKLHDVEGEWPVWGLPKVIGVDNGADFRSKSFERSCMQYGIRIEFRPVESAHYGGNIESAIGSIAKAIHTLPGTTFSSVHEKGEYDSEEKAALTFSEFETWLVKEILKRNNIIEHSETGMTPLRKWEIGTFGNAETEGVGMMPIPTDRMRVQIDFMPAEDRTVQPDGVTIDNLRYYSETLNPWIGATTEGTIEGTHQKRTLKRKFVVRRDPRDVSVAWFFDPEAEQYYELHVANQDLAPMSHWEHQQAKEKLRQDGISNYSEEQLYEVLTEQRDLVEASMEKTRKARRESSRRKQREKKVSPASPQPPQPDDDQLETLSTDAVTSDGFTADFSDDIFSGFGRVS